VTQQRSVDDRDSWPDRIRIDGIAVGDQKGPMALVEGNLSPAAEPHVDDVPIKAEGGGIPRHREQDGAEGCPHHS
jgi:hypothetical protein